MKCISVYTRDFEQFSDIFEKVLDAPMQENEELQIDGITVTESGEVPENYLEKMRAKSEVVVMKEKERNIMILQHGNVFEILLPGVLKESVVL